MDLAESQLEDSYSSSFFMAIRKSKQLLAWTLRFIGDHFIAFLTIGFLVLMICFVGPLRGMSDLWATPLLPTTFPSSDSPTAFFDTISNDIFGLKANFTNILSINLNVKYAIRDITAQIDCAGQIYEGAELLNICHNVSKLQRKQVYQLPKDLHKINGHWSAGMLQLRILDRTATEVLKSNKNLSPSARFFWRLLYSKFPTLYAYTDESQFYTHLSTFLPQLHDELVLDLTLIQAWITDSEIISCGITKLIFTLQSSSDTYQHTCIDANCYPPHMFFPIANRDFKLPGECRSPAQYVPWLRQVKEKLKEVQSFWETLSFKYEAIVLWLEDLEKRTVKEIEVARGTQRVVVVAKEEDGLGSLGRLLSPFITVMKEEEKTLKD